MRYKGVLDILEGRGYAIDMAASLVADSEGEAC